MNKIKEYIKFKKNSLTAKPRQQRGGTPIKQPHGYANPTPHPSPSEQ